MAPGAAGTTTNRLDAARQAARPAVGTICVLDGYVPSQLAGAAGADVVLVDKQHAAFDWSQLETMCWRVAATGAAVYVRTASLDPAELNLVVDLPVDGVMLPNATGVEDARRGLSTTRFPPRGDRSIGNVRTSVLAGRDFRDAQEPRGGLLIEHVGAVEAIDDILSLGLCDFVMVGPHDLAASMGLDAHTEPDRPPALDDAIAEVRRCADRHGVGWWSWLASTDGADDPSHRGSEALLWSVDGLVLESALRTGFSAVRTALGS